MKFVYILETEDGENFYVGLTDNVAARLAEHNRGKVIHTSRFHSWKVRTFIGFSDDARAVAFERYLKTGSGRAFSTKRL
jgi:putative endonuclease